MTAIVSLDFRDNEPVVGLDASGCVKTTPLNVIAGFLTPTSGQVLRLVVLKGALPEIINGMRAAIALGWTTLVAAQAGIGVMVLNAARFLATDVVFLGIVVIGAVAFVFDLIMRRIERMLVPCKGQA